MVGYVEAIEYIEIEAARRVADLVATDHDQGNLVATWRESKEPLTAVSSSNATSHLSFTASVENAVFADDGSGAAGRTLTVSCDLIVAFTYRIPAVGGVAATRKASRAAMQIVGAMLKSWPEAVVNPRTAYRPGPIVGEFMQVETRFAVQIDANI